MEVGSADMTNAKKALLQVNGAYFWLSVLESCFQVGYFAYLISILGSVSQANWLQFIFWTSMFIFEIPTGFITDRIGAKKSLILAAFGRMGAFLLFFFGAHMPELLVLGHILAGVSLTFFTGVFSLQLKQFAANHSIEIDYSKATKQGAVFRNFGLIIGTFIGFIIIKFFNIQYLWIASIFLSLILVGHVGVFWQSFPGQPLHVYGHVRESISILRTNTTLLRGLILNACLLFGTLGILTNWIPIFVPALESTPELLSISVIAVAAIKIFAAVVPLPRFWNKSEFLLGTLGVVLIGAGLSLGVAQIVLFILSLCLITGCEILIRGQILNELPEKHAGILSSIQSLLENLVGALAFGVLGVLTGVRSVPFSWFLSGVFLVAVAGIMCAWVGAVRNKARES